MIQILELTRFLHANRMLLRSKTLHRIGRKSGYRLFANTDAQTLRAI